jgi:hypothetical protein
VAPRNERLRHLAELQVDDLGYRSVTAHGHQHDD